MINVKLLLFDIGNVLVKLTGATIIQRNSKQALEQEYIWETWAKIDGVREFESGRCDQETFADEVTRFYDLNLEPGEFIELFKSTVESVYEGVDVFLDMLSADYELACLTNTNSLHWPKIRDEFGLGGFFERQYVSYEIGHVKPERKIFEHVLNDTGLQPRDILFVDDNIENIQIAKELGFSCCHAVGFEEVRMKVSQLL